VTNKTGEESIDGDLHSKRDRLLRLLTELTQQPSSSLEKGGVARLQLPEYRELSKAKKRLYKNWINGLEAISGTDKWTEEVWNQMYDDTKKMIEGLINDEETAIKSEIIELIKKNIFTLECNLNSIVNQSDQSNPIINVHFDGSRQIIKTLYELLEYIDTEAAK
tara:strand:+ start:3974 stop:4465 length:492 start_codon:yes stop_codon:yes gene_type:complete